ncbi:MAG TPA: 4-hydroxy-tetrahydrodipicolinate reductase [Deltaproteobacteria bacterium]|nr:4-hydroxy-tetrahydrodipicolinate reductase [Deltaproteobacteria bacterium]
MIHAGVVGIAGRMGSLLAQGIIDAEDMVLAGALEAKGHPVLGKDAGTIVGRDLQGVGISCVFEEAFASCDVIIDFTMPAVTVETARYAQEESKHLIIGTTGFDEEQLLMIRDCAGKVPVVMAPNMSIGVNVMFKVAAILTELLGKDYDVEIIEAHHRLKKDAPSGTALGLAISIAEAKGVELAKNACYERHGIIGARPDGEIGIQTLRAGDIVGDHTVLYAGNNERIELKHQAHSRQNFARGALRAVRWLKGREPGLYSMIDVLGL